MSRRIANFLNGANQATHYETEKQKRQGGHKDRKSTKKKLRDHYGSEKLKEN